jgi:hypothetical protein
MTSLQTIYYLLTETRFLYFNGYLDNSFEQIEGNSEPNLIIIIGNLRLFRWNFITTCLRFLCTTLLRES